MSIAIDPYDASQGARWDDFIAHSKNGTFLLQRGYMDYHADRFADASLMIRNAGELIALLPANRSGDTLHSHQGLTYGGLVTGADMTTPLMLDVFDALRARLAADHIARLVYKTVPTIYHRMPAEEDRYALFRHGASLTRRDVLCVVPAARPAPVQDRRRRGAAKARKAGVEIAASQDWPAFWALLGETLATRHNAKPVHTLDEIALLAGRFPQAIRLHVAHKGGAVLAGAVIYDSPAVAHCQYIASSEEGRQIGALDAMFLDLLENAYAERDFDFGISNEENGRVLNRGLIEQKEGFGGRAVVHDFYELTV